jgi:hypothetical protein
MNLVYVTHSVVVEKRFALVVKDEEDLKRVLAEREAKVKAAQFKSKAARDKKGALELYPLNPDWHSAPNDAFDGTSKSE